MDKEIDLGLTYEVDREAQTVKIQDGDQIVTMSFTNWDKLQQSVGRPGKDQ